MKVRIAIFIAIAVMAGLIFLGLGVRRTEYAPNWLAPPLAAPSTAGELVVLTLRGPTTTQSVPRDAAGLFSRGENQTGFEHDLATMFAEELGVAVKFRVMPSYSKLIHQLEANRAHIAAAGLSPSPDLRQKFAFGPAYKTIQYQVIYRTADKRPKNIADLGNQRLAVIAETPAHDIARDLTESSPNLVIEVLPHEAEPEALLKALESSRADVALVDTFAFADAKRIHPDLGAAFKVGREAKVAWAFSNAADAGLQQSVARFFEKIRGNGALNRLMDRYYGHIDRIQPVDAEALLEKMQSELPKLRPFFYEAQRLTDIDWRIFAAVGYQESHWDPFATSPTGVRGLMMLTEETADRMKVQNRLDARQSIVGGAKYISLLRDTVPSRIPEPDRTWLALAAYNQGYGHLEDARILTARMGLNPDSWLDVRKAYPKLREPEYYETLKHGFCRGDETVQFVENIRNYTDILNRLEKPLATERSGDIKFDEAAPAQAFGRRRVGR
jgi:membrane-bound lytic murein transglycosylase F